MEKALRFYMGYLSSQANQDYLADVIPSTVRGSWTKAPTAWADCFSRWQWNRLTSNILAVCEVDQQELERLRNQCIQQIRKTNGMISFEQSPALAKR